MNIIKYSVYLLIVFSVVKNYQKSMIDNNLLLFITIIIIIGFMITDSFFKPNIKEGFAVNGVSCTNDLGCDSGYCRNNICSAKIPAGEYCHAPNTNSANYCEDGYYCYGSGSRCVARISAGSACEQGKIVAQCVNGYYCSEANDTCVPTVPNPTCSDDNNCNGSQFCDYKTCVSRINRNGRCNNSRQCNDKLRCTENKNGNRSYCK